MSEVTAAKDQRNPLNCENGWDECDHSKLTPLEVGQTASAVHQRNSSLAEATNTLPVFRLRAMGSHLVSGYGEKDAWPYHSVGRKANQRQCVV